MICNDLRGTDGKTDRLRSCRGCVMDCAQIVEEVLFPGEFEPYDGPSEFIIKKEEPFGSSFLLKVLIDKCKIASFGGIFGMRLIPQKGFLQSLQQIFLLHK